MNIASTLGRLATFGLLLASVLSAQASPQIPGWKPLFKGIDHIVATNLTSSGDFQNLMVANALRIDLTDPDIRLLTTRSNANYVPNTRETAGMTVSRFVQTQHVQAAVNGNFFSPAENYLPEGTAMALDGLEISEGAVVSPQRSSQNSAAVLFDVSNHCTILHTNWPATNNAGIYTAVSGDYPLVIKGVNIGRRYLGSGGIHDTNPRTSYGRSQDGRYLYLVTIDGRQAGYSEGAYDYETGAWMLAFGAYDAVNMDGGGSTTMVIADAAGNPHRLNNPSTVADSGKERTVGSHFGIFAQPLVGFISKVAALPDDDAASVTWTTTSPASSQVEYDTNEDFTMATTVQAETVTNHAVLLTDLQPGTGYFFRAVSTVGPTRYTSPSFFFTTTNYVTTNQVIALTDSWKYTSSSQSDTDWTASGYNDTAWSGPGAGLLWVDTRSTGPNPDVGPRGEQMPFDPGTGFPHVTYYFRKHFSVPAAAAGAALQFSAQVDDGAMLYLNGHEIYRLRMDPAPTVITSDTLAATYPCDGDAVTTCFDDFLLTGDAASYLVAGDNVLAVEVHNYNARSADITFGLNLGITEPSQSNPQLDLTRDDSGTSLSWTRGGFTLQQAGSPEGPWTDVPGPVISGPFTPDVSGPTRYYRLHK
ncbi:MAG TPA: phosphodiester glycosidase family protein [Candidatus Limnocylindria bacterium]|nr:phosphodiester glycosidase family protein [Candidatus Limnocylindria bacterium]